MNGTGQIERVLLVHGYSETSLGAYYSVPELLAAQGYTTIVLSAFNSLDDHVSIDDLAEALERRVDFVQLGDLARTAIVCHSTGALVVRRWMLNRIAKNLDLPARLITMAGANHGSTLAEIGKSVVGYLEKIVQAHEFTVGARVLTDLDYGSAFLLKLNTEWLVEWNKPQGPLAKTLLFSMVGDYIGDDKSMLVFWGTHEPGCDNTVRISGANLNYTVMEIDPQATPPKMGYSVPNRTIPHRIIPGKSHFGNVTGILGFTTPTDEAFKLLLRALSVADSEYDELAATWAADNDKTWFENPTADRYGVANPDKQNATVVFDVRDRGGEAVDDCVIAFWDEKELAGDPRAIVLGNPAMAQQVAEAMRSSSGAVNQHSPMHNDVQRSAYSFYLNFPKWSAAEHAVYVEAHSESNVVDYVPVVLRPPHDLGRKLVQPNEFTYVKLTLTREPDHAYTFYGWQPDFSLTLRQNTIWKNGTFPTEYELGPPGAPAGGIAGNPSAQAMPAVQAGNPTVPPPGETRPPGPGSAPSGPWAWLRRIFRG